MKAPRIPARAPIGDSFKGFVLKGEENYFLAQTPIPDLEIIQEGTVIVRYGVVYLGKPHLSIVPALLALDYGNFMTGEAAWDFLLNKSNLFPRADVLGYNNTGTDEQVFIKELDLMYPFDILVYKDAETSKPLANIAAVIIENKASLAPRLAAYASIYPTLEAWKKAAK